MSLYTYVIHIVTHKKPTVQILILPKSEVIDLMNKCKMYLKTNECQQQNIIATRETINFHCII